jgi:glycosyltransferase involved in cell wall biosynthesis
MIFLSIVIPIRNEEKFIGETLAALAAQDYPRDRFELLVVDGRSTDRTREVVDGFIKEHPDLNICLLDNPGLLSSRARNIGIKAAQGQLIGVIDGHVYIPTDKLFASMERSAVENKALCLSRPAPLNVPTITCGAPFWIAIARKTWLGHSSQSYIYKEFSGFVDPVSAGFAYDRSVFEMVGYFDENFDAAEDVEFHYRLKKAGILSYIEPGLLIYSYPRDSLRSLFRQQVRYGEGRARLILKHPDAFTKETLIPIGIFVVSLLWPLTTIFAGSYPLLTGLVTLGMGIYLSVVLITSLAESIRRGRFFPGFLIFAAIWVTHYALGWGFIKRVFSQQHQ